MFGYISGTLASIDGNIAVVDCGGVGYEIAVTNSCFELCVLGKPVKLFVYLNVREDEMSLFGFSTIEEKQLYLKLISVSGVGAKTGLAIIGALNTQMLKSAIVQGNTALIASVKGIGKKTAERIVLELKDKIDEPSFSAAAPVLAQANDAVLALSALGFGQNEARRMIESVDTNGKSTEEIVRLALKNNR